MSTSDFDSVIATSALRLKECLSAAIEYVVLEAQKGHAVRSVTLQPFNGLVNVVTEDEQGACYSSVLALRPHAPNDPPPIKKAAKTQKPRVLNFPRKGG